MSIVNTAGLQRAFGSFGDVEELSQSTATTRQSISTVRPVTTLGGGGATGFGVNLYTLAAFATSGWSTASGAGPNEGFIKIIKMLATGEAKVVIEGIATGRIPGIFEIATTTNTAPQSVMTAASATGAFVLSNPTHFLWCQVIDGKWQVLAGAATFATAT